MASFIDCFVAKGQRRAWQGGEEGAGVRGTRCQPWGCATGDKCQPWAGQGGAPSVGSHCTGTHCSPSCLSFPASRWAGRTGQWPAAPWAGCVGKEALGAGGKSLCPREGGRCAQQGCLCLCVQAGGLCLWSGQGEGSVFLGRSSEAALELVSGDSDSAGRWRCSFSPDNIIFHGSSVPRSLEELAAPWGHRSPSLPGL